MKISKLILTVILILMISTLALSQTAEEIVARAIEAEGGAARAAINTMGLQGKISVPMQGMEGHFVTLTKRPSKIHVRIVVQGMEIIQATNGTVCWSVNPFTGSTAATEMPAAQAAAFIRRADFDGEYSNIAAKGIKAEFVGKETVDDVEVNHVKLTFKDGHEKSFFFNAETGLLYMSKEMAPNPMGGEVEMSVVLSDYRDVEGMKIPFKTKQSTAGMDMFIEFEEIQTNIDIDDSLFDMPAAEEETK